MSKIEVQKIEIKIGGKTISLSPEELRELRDVLDATFPKAQVTYVLPTAPIVIERPDLSLPRLAMVESSVG